MSGAEKPDYIGADEYLIQEGSSSEIKHEYVDGWVRAMTGATNRHNRVCINCTFQLMKQLQGKPCQPCNSDTKVRIEQRGLTRFYYPDLQVVCDPNPESDPFQDHPKLIIEILSASTRRYDLDEKLFAYTQIASLDYYIVLEQHQPIAIVLRRIDGEPVMQIGSARYLRWSHFHVKQCARSRVAVRIRVTLAVNAVVHFDASLR